VYSNPKVAAFITRHFAPVRAHVRDTAELFKQLGQRFNAQWTPTVLIVDSDGRERHRIEGFLPADEFLAQLRLGLAHSAFSRGGFAEAEPLFTAVAHEHSDTDAAPEAVYWSGVSRYKATNDAAALAETARAFSERYQDSSWAKKASVWKT
jgi:Thioredoxin-like domain